MGSQEVVRARFEPHISNTKQMCYLIYCDVLSFSVSMCMVAQLPLELGRYSDSIRRECWSLEIPCGCLVLKEKA